MSRIEQTFHALKLSGKKALITFIMAGDPDAEASFSVLEKLPESGVDLIEIGMPFTDPAADGLTIQHAGQRALKSGATLLRTIDMVRRFRENNKNTPIILMGYANPLYAYGLEKFAKDVATAGVDGLIIVDLPPEEDEPLRVHTKKHGIDMIRLITPTTDEKRLPTVLNGASGFLYYVSITGVTGAATADMNSLKPHIDMIKTKTHLPIAIGFGIRTPDDAAQMAQIGDAVVVGSAIVDKIKDMNQNKDGLASVLGFVSSLSEGLKTRLS